MKQLTCEMCGSTDLLKQDNVFVCQTCGTKYSVEEAKKMMIEGTVNIDNSTRIQNNIKNAIRAMASGELYSCHTLCDKVLEMDPYCFIALIYKVYLSKSTSGAVSYIDDAIDGGVFYDESERTEAAKFIAKHFYAFWKISKIEKVLDKIFDGDDDKLMKVFYQEVYMNPEFNNYRVAEHFEDLQKIKSFDLSDETSISVLSTILARTLFFYVEMECGLYKYKSLFSTEYKGEDIVKNVFNIYNGEEDPEECICDIRPIYSQIIDICPEFDMTAAWVMALNSVLNKNILEHSAIVEAYKTSGKLPKDWCDDFVETVESNISFIKEYDSSYCLDEKTQKVFDEIKEFLKDTDLEKLIKVSEMEERLKKDIRDIKDDIRRIEEYGDSLWTEYFNRDREKILKYYKPEYVLDKELKAEVDEALNYQPKKSGCYVATCVYGSYDCPQVWTLRRYRDYTLSETRYGRAFIKIYYAISPTLVKWFGNTNWFKKLWKKPLDKMVKSLNEQGVEDTKYNDKI